LQILHDISSSCVSGKLTALMGPSGAGKSSLVSTAARQQQQQCGVAQQQESLGQGIAMSLTTLGTEGRLLFARMGTAAALSLPAVPQAYLWLCDAHVQGPAHVCVSTVLMLNCFATAAVLLPLLPLLPVCCCCRQLDILAGVKVAGKARGQVLLNGSPRRSAAFASLASYVQQKDVLVPSATVSSSSSSIEMLSW
jgi:ABC-type cobalamin/Fe3+-siderophores transport system ATPase subunit